MNRKRLIEFDVLVAVKASKQINATIATSHSVKHTSYNLTPKKLTSLTYCKEAHSVFEKPMPDDDLSMLPDDVLVFLLPSKAAGLANC